MSVGFLDNMLKTFVPDSGPGGSTTSDFSLQTLTGGSDLVAFQPGGTLTRPAPPTLPPPTVTPPATGPKPVNPGGSGHPGGSGSPGGAPAPLLPGRPAFGGVDSPSGADGKLVNPGNLESSMGLLQEGLGRLHRDDMLGRLDSLVSLGNRGEGATLPFGHGNDFVNARYNPSSGNVEFGNGARIPLSELLDRLRVRDEDLRQPSLSDLAAVRNGPQAQGGLAGALNPTLPPPEPAPVEGPSAPAAPAAPPRTSEERRNEAYRQGFAKLADYRLGGQKPDVMPPGEESYVDLMAQAQQAQGRAAVTFRMPVTVDGQTFQLPGYFSGTPENVEQFKREMGPKNGLKFDPVLPPGGSAAPPAGKPSTPSSPSTPSKPSTGSPTAGSPVTSPPAQAPVDPGPSLDEMIRRSEAESAQRLSERVKTVGAFQDAEAGLQRATEGVRHSPGLTPPPTKEKVEQFLDAFQLFQAAKKEYSRSQNVTMESLVSLHYGPAVQMLDELKKQGRVTQDPSGRLRALDPPAPSTTAPGQGSEENKTPAPATDPSKPVPAPVGTDEDDKRRREIGVYTRVELNPYNGDMLGATNYVDPANDTNLIVNRLVHKAEDEARGHDAIHLITGFGLNPISASRAGATFPETAVDLQALGRLPPDSVQENLNGVLIENINDGVWEAMKSTVDTDAIVRSLPPELQRYGEKVLQDLDQRTGYNIAQPGIDPGSDFGRQVEELGSMGTVTQDPDDGTKQSYAPNTDTVGVHHDNFTKLLTHYPSVKEELTLNLSKYVEYAAQVEKSMAETGNPPNLPPLEIVVSPETTQALMRTAMAGLGQLQQKYPDAPAVPQLRNYYDKVLREGDYGTPEVSKLPQGSTSTIA